MQISQIFATIVLLLYRTCDYEKKKPANSEESTMFSTLNKLQCFAVFFDCCFNLQSVCKLYLQFSAFVLFLPRLGQ